MAAHKGSGQRCGNLRGLNYRSYVKEACELLRKLRADECCLDNFVEDASKDLQNKDAPERKFILDVVSGCVQYKKLLDAVVNMFYGLNKKWVSKGDHSQFVVICYLTMFALDDLGVQNFSNIIKSLGINKMHFFVNFFFSHLTPWIQEEWNGIYDVDFVEKEWIVPLLRWRPEISSLMDQLFEESQVQKAHVKTTQPQEFNLTNPKARPVPEMIPHEEKRKAVPKGFNSANKAEAKISSVKLNNAAILRQEVLYHRLVEEEQQRIEQLVQGARDSSSFLQWQQEMREKDLQEKLPRMKQKHLETRISEENVALVRKQVAENNQKAAQLKKEETFQLMQKYAEKRMQEEKELRDLVQQVAKGHKNPKAAKEKLQKLKQNIVKEVSEHNQELLRQALEEEQVRLCENVKKISEIHAVESLQRDKTSRFDDTETAGHQMGEMSLAELKQRLAFLKQSQQQELEERHSQILQENKKKKQDMQEKLETISLHNRTLAQAAANRKEEKRAKQEFLKQLVDQDETVLALKKKLEEQKQQRRQLKLLEKSKTKPQTGTPAAAQTETHGRQTSNRKNWEEINQQM
ncbi:cilia- and flagella-associated protein 99 isoform X1 [Nothobranchius furzeri]|uniref:Cilia and flagella associated protein 99 n=3 Tax=Nothobranchius furzeri TaxID=105023 RepID=A0A1A7ZGS0_NOTFU|nr:transcript variant X1 [Nothobranchius furzeri]